MRCRFSRGFNCELGRSRTRTSTHFFGLGVARCRFATASMLVDHHHKHHHTYHFHDEDVLAALTLPSGSELDLKVDDEVTDGVQLGGATVVMSHLARISEGEKASVLLEGAVT